MTKNKLYRLGTQGYDISRHRKCMYVIYTLCTSYLWRSIVCFVCQVEISQTMAWHLCHALGGVGKPSMTKGASSWFHNVSNYNGEVIEYVEQFFSLKIHLNQ